MKIDNTEWWVRLISQRLSMQKPRNNRAYRTDNLLNISRQFLRSSSLMPNRQRTLFQHFAQTYDR